MYDETETAFPAIILKATFFGNVHDDEEKIKTYVEGILSPLWTIDQCFETQSLVLNLPCNVSCKSSVVEVIYSGPKTSEGLPIINFIFACATLKSFLRLPNRIIALPYVRLRNTWTQFPEIAGNIGVSVKVKIQISIVNVYVSKRATDVIIGCDFCDKHVEAIRQRQEWMELDDCSPFP